MASKTAHKRLENLVEQKILEFFGDPDATRTLKPSFLSMLNKRMKKVQKLTPNTTVARQHGVS